MTPLNNPFVVYGYKGAEYFCDRADETARLLSALHGERNVTLVSPRRMGKTGLIHHLFGSIEAAEPDTRCFYIDIYSTKNEEQLVRLLAAEIIGKLDTMTQSVMRRIQDFFSRWRPVISVDAATGMPTVSLDVRQAESHDTLRQIFEYMKQSGRRCYVAIDEFQQIATYPEGGTEALIRSCIQFLPNVYFIFAGSQQHIMNEMFLSANRPFYQSSIIMTLAPIAADTYRAFANDKLSRQQRHIDNATFAYLYGDVAGGVTWYVQALLHGIYECEKQKTIDLTLVDSVLREAVEEQAAAYENYCAWLTANQLALLRAVASERSVPEPLSREFIKAHNLSAASSVKTALRALCDRQMVHRGAKGYEVSDRFFAIWLRGRR